ncbi:MAG: ribosome small subunit-dependent GTPase A [Balneolaceae bacterium]
MTGTVIQSTGKWIHVKPDGDAEVLSCRVRGKLRLTHHDSSNPVAVGDRVQYESNNDGTGTVTGVEERRNFIPRKAMHRTGDRQVLAANVDNVWVLQSVRQPKPKQGFIDRCLAACEAFSIEAGLILNKTDLAGKKEAAEVARLKAIYEPLGYNVITTSIHDAEQLEALRAMVTGSNSVFIGHSGVGKSSLINALIPGIDLPTGDVSSHNEKGKHTTTYARMLPLPDGGFIIDTPGIREFALTDIEPEDLWHFFPEMRDVGNDCKFYNCSHDHEPGCGVVAAYEQGNIHPDRYHSYLTILDTLKE